MAEHMPGKEQPGLAHHNQDRDVSNLAYGYYTSTALDFSDIDTWVKAKDLIDVPALLALALQKDGWYLRSDIAWCKTSAMPESVRDRPTSAWEHIWLLSKSTRYWYDADAVREPYNPASLSRYDSPMQGTDRNGGQIGGARQPGGVWAPVNVKMEPNPLGANLRNFWLLGPEPYSEAHFAVFPTEIPRRAIRAGCPVGGMVLDPFAGSGTTLFVAEEEGRDSIGIELNPEYCKLAEKRLRGARTPLPGLL